MVIVFGLMMFMFGMGLGIRIANDNWKEAMQGTLLEIQNR